MTNGEKQETHWRKLCLQVAKEPDPERLSELVEQLINTLDDLKRRLDGEDTSPVVNENERAPVKPSTS